jgi:serine/threonine protein kinase
MIFATDVEMRMKFWYNGQPIEELGERYRLEGHLGSGGMADVFLAWDEKEKREVAIKILKANDLDQETLNRFMKEASQIVGWQHPHILHVYDTMQIELLDPAQGSVLFYIVTEFASGGDLHQRLTPKQPFPLSATFALFRQLCDAVQYAHEHGVIHRDLKPPNILFRRPAEGPEEVVLSDFGLAVQMDASHYTFARGGTLAYMAPEQFEGHISPACDIFALGVILYLLCTGHLPFRRTIQDLPNLGKAALPTRPSLLNPDLPPDLDEPILRALLEQPTERYHSVQEFWDAIELAVTSTAQTYPFLSDDSWQAAGITWPFDSSAQPPTRKQTSQPTSLASQPVPTAAKEGQTSRRQPAPTGRSLHEEISNPGIITFDSQPLVTRSRKPATDPYSTRVLSGGRRTVSEQDQSITRRQPSQVNQKRPTHKRKLPLVPVLTSLAVLLLIGAILVAANVQGSLLLLFGMPITTVTLIPRSQSEQNNYLLTAVTSIPDPANRQIPARLLTTTATRKQATGNVSGSIQATTAHGRLLFLNNTNHDVVVQTTNFTGKSGVPVTFQGPVTVPFNNPTFIEVPAFAVNPGAAGNIPQFDIVQNCCATGIVVKNTAFTGGQDAQPNNIVQQSDIDTIAHPLIVAQTQSDQTSLKEQVKSNERVVDGSLQCQPNTNSNHQAGDTAKTVTVTVAVTCSEEAYDYQAAQATATNLLQAQAASDPTLRAGYKLDGQIVVNVQSSVVADSGGQVNLNVQARGLWVYNFSTAGLHHLASLIAGKSETDARTFLLQQPGIADVQFSSNGGLPVNISEIQVVVKMPLS